MKHILDNMRQLLVCLLIVLQPTIHGTTTCYAAENSAPFPQWKVGDEWWLDTHRHKRKVARWHMRVAGKHEKGSFCYWRIVARETFGSGQQLGLLLARSDTLSFLVSTECTSKDGSRSQQDHLHRNAPHPVLAKDSLVPASSPLIETNCLARQAEGRLFRVTNQAGGLSFASDCFQRSHGIDKDNFTELSLPLKASERTNCRLTVIERAADKRSCKQLWHPKYPWFLYCKDGSIEHRLQRVTIRQHRQE